MVKRKIGKHTIVITVPKGYVVKTKHKKSTHNPIFVELGRDGLSFGYKRRKRGLLNEE